MTNDPIDHAGPRAYVAIIAVHGVGDPESGDTSAQLADLLLATCREAGIGGPGFEKAEIQIAVESEWQLGSRPANEGMSIGHSREALAGLRDGQPLGSYLTVRRAGEVPDSKSRPRPVHIYELNWADLSRAPGLLAQVILNLYQLAFHLAVLGRRAVSLARGEVESGRTQGVDAVDDEAQLPAGQAGPAVRAADRVQHLAQWLLPTTIPVLNLFLLAATLPLIGLYLPEGMDGAVGAAILGLGVLVAAAYMGIRQVRHGPLGAAVAALVYGICMFLLPTTVRLGFIGLAIVIGATVLALLTSLAVVRPHPKMRPMVAATLVMVVGFWAYGLWSGLHQPDLRPFEQQYQVMLLASTQVVHALFLVLQIAWALLWLAMMAAWGTWVARRLGGAGAADPSARALYSGALGLMLSATVFFMLTIVLWSAILDRVSGRMKELPLSFDAPFPLLYSGLTDVSGNLALAEYAQRLFRLTTGDGANGFLVALVLCAVIAIAAILPSAWYESRQADRSSRAEPGLTSRLGAWLDDGFSALSVAAGVLVAAFVWLALGYHPWLAGLSFLPDKLVGQDLVRWLGAGLAGSIPLILLLRKQLPSAGRNALDILLDVDNWLREAPGRGTPRGRILARFLSLLRFVASSGRYGRILIVAHSQGTVIAADMLRLLQASPRLASQVFGSGATPEIRLITAGSPLRQLYARRFPHEYGWVEHPGSAGPNPAGLYGVRSWINLYNAGDYVGRALWSPAPDCPWDPAVSPLDAKTQTRDILLGVGAHTHYFDAVDSRVCLVIRHQIGET